jgi:hypothetical protein
MNKPLTNPSKFLKNKWRNLDMESHYRRMEHVRSIVDTTQPQKLRMRTSKSQRERIEEARLYQIQQENTKLVARMTTIMTGKSSARPIQTTPLQRSYWSRRKRELEEITHENLSMLSRLQGQKSAYDVKKFKHDRKFHERMLKHLCEYPYPLSKTSSNRVLMYAGSAASGFKTASSAKELSKARPKLPRDKASGLKLAHSERGLMTAKPKQSQGRDASVARGLQTAKSKPSHSKQIVSDEILHSSAIKIGSKTCAVAVVKSGRRLLMIVQETGKGDSFSLMLSRKEALKIMIKPANYQRLLEALAFEDGEFVLKTPSHVTSRPEATQTREHVAEEQIIEGRYGDEDRSSARYDFSDSERSYPDKIRIVSEKPTMDKADRPSSDSFITGQPRSSSSSREDKPSSNIRVFDDVKASALSIPSSKAEQQVKSSSISSISSLE